MLKSKFSIERIEKFVNSILPYLRTFTGFSMEYFDEVFGIYDTYPYEKTCR